MHAGFKYIYTVHIKAPLFQSRSNVRGSLGHRNRTTALGWRGLSRRLLFGKYAYLVPMAMRLAASFPVAALLLICRV